MPARKSGIEPGEKIINYITAQAKAFKIKDCFSSAR